MLPVGDVGPVPMLHTLGGGGDPELGVLGRGHRVSHWDQPGSLVLTQMGRWGQLSAVLEELGSAYSTSPSQKRPAWHPPPVFRTGSHRGQSRQSSGTRWSCGSERYGLKKPRDPR